MSRVYKISSIDGEFLIHHYPPPKVEEEPLEEEGDDKEEEEEDQVPVISPEEEREALLEEARLKANSIIKKAKEQSHSLLEEAKKKARLLQDQAQKKGLIEGQREGRDAFLKKARELFNRLEISLQEIHYRMKNYEEEYPTKITQLSLGIAREVIRREVQEDPTIVVKVARDALASMNGVAKATIRVNWKDLEVMESAKEELLSSLKGLRRVDFQVDENLEQGGTIIETPQGGVDASIQTRFSKIKESLLEVINSE